ncbi:vWA domain-containing protein [Amphibiibacter pelophylacis]|uniref:VWA domain-containing protein n=1 Tax=Amphibiibacter pelophylacis TaxID=1799477 RepID=A0ACC6P350_9BURK
MLIAFFQVLRQHRLPVSPRELLTLIEALLAGVLDADQGGPGPSLDAFYHLARATLIKDESLYDRFDLAFAQYVRGGVADGVAHADLTRDIPLDWLVQRLQSLLSDERKKNAPLIHWDDLLKTLNERLNEQKGRHEGGSKWVGTGGTSPFGHGGHNPQGVRIGGPGRQRQAVKVWEQREFRDYDSDAELHPRTLQMALRRLRRFARQGQASELALDATVRATAANAGWLDLKLVPERRNAVKVLLLMDVGGSMDDHVQAVQNLFSAARSEFRQLEFFYFHNCVYEHVWRSRAGSSQRLSTQELLHTYNSDYRLILVGDATMSPYEITHVGGSVAHHNAEPGAVWLGRLLQAWPRHVWLNPEPQGVWTYRPSIGLIRELVSQRMYPLSLQGLEAAMGSLSR